jgi:membrane protease subunit HflC
LETINFFPKNIQDWDGDPGQIPTLDKTFIWVDAFARWKIVDPKKFLLTTRDNIGAAARLNDILDPAVRNFITSNQLIEAVRRSNRELDLREVGIPIEDTIPPRLIHHRCRSGKNYPGYPGAGPAETGQIWD